MKLATTAEEGRRWVEPEREEAIALAEEKRDELAYLTDDEAWHVAALLSLASFSREPTDTSGLVEPQAWFMRLRFHE